MSWWRSLFFAYMPFPLFLILLGVAFLLGGDERDDGLLLNTQASDITYRYQNAVGREVFLRAAQATALPDGQMQIKNLNLSFNTAARQVSFDGETGAVDSAHRALTMNTVRGWLRTPGTTGANAAAPVSVSVSLANLSYNLNGETLSGSQVRLQRGTDQITGEQFRMTPEAILIQGQVQATYTGL